MADFASITTLFTDEFSRDLHARRAESIKRLARANAGGFLVRDFPPLHEVLAHAVASLEDPDAAMGPALVPLMIALAKVRLCRAMSLPGVPCLPCSLPAHPHAASAAIPAVQGRRGAFTTEC